MVVSLVDIGTNTVLLLVARLDNQGRITPLAYEQRIPRLGRGVDKHGVLNQESMERVLHVLEEYQRLATPFAPEAMVVCGTSAVREAHNKEQFGRLMKERTGLTLEILSGEDEALWTYRGAISGINDLDRALVVDIGGGSTEITLGDHDRIRRTVSLNIGSVRLTERIFRHDPPEGHEVEEAAVLVKDELAKLRSFSVRDSTLVGVAGTATSLAVLDQGLREFSLQAVTNYRLEASHVEALFQMLKATHSAQILRLSTMMEGRSDILTAGTLILREIMAFFSFSAMIVSERGVRYGLALREWEKKGAS